MRSRDPVARFAAIALVVFAAAVPLVGCSNGSSGPASVRSALLQCTKDSTVLDSLATVPRTCAVDDDCPYGAYCDLVTQVCKYDCTTDDACASGTVCDCDGRCEPSSGVPLSSALAPPKLTTSPAFVALGGFAPDAWSPRQVDAVLTTPDAQVAGSDALHPRVVVTAGAGLEVTCASDGRQGNAYGPSCELTDWTFFQSGTQYRAVHTLWVRPLAGTTESKWELRLAARSGTTTVAIALTNRAGGLVGVEGATTPQPREGSYVGTMVINASADVVADSARALHVPISALVRNDRIVLVDPTAALSTAGSLLVGAQGESRTTTWLTPTTAGGAGGGQLLVTYSFATAPQWMELDGRVVGTFDETLLTNPSAVRHVSYQLQRVGPVTATCDGGSCDAGAACEPTTRTCLPAGVLAPSASVDPATNGMANVDSQRWWSDEQALIASNARFAAEGTNASEALLCADIDAGTGVRTLVPTTLTTSGDFACTGNKPPLAVGLVEHADLVKSGTLSAALTGPDMLKSCLSDLATAAPTAAIDPAASDDALRATFGKNPCISLARYYAALHQAAVGSLKATSGVAERDRYGGTLFMHLLAQWLDVHSFVARESMQEQQLRPLLDGTPPPDVQTTLDQLEQGWDLVLAKENVDRLGAMSAAQLRNPDYRVAKRPIAYWSFGPNDVDQANRIIKDLVGSHPATFTKANPTQPTVFAMMDNSGWSAHAPWPTDASSDYSVSFWISDAEPHYRGTLGQPGYSMLTRVLRLNGNGQADDFSYYFNALNGTQLWMSLFEELYAGGSTAGGLPYGGPDVVTIAVNGNANTARVYHHGAAPTGTFQVPASIDSLDIHLPQSTWPDGGVAKMVGVAVWDSALGQQDHDQLLVAAATPYPGFTLAPTLPTGQDYEQNVGLPAKLVETASSHLAFLNQYLDDFTYQQYGQCDAKASARAIALARLGKGLRYADAVDGLATGLYNAAAALPGGVDWEKRWQAAHDELDGLRVRTMQLAARVRDCANPLGISDQDLPLYFGDTTGPINAFFASSMYLGTQWADPAIQSAAGSLATVRDAWIQQKNSTIQDQVAADEAQRRLEALYTQYYQPIIDLCGLSGIDPKDVPAQFVDGGGSLTADNCFIARSNGCQDMTAKLLAKVDDSHARYALGTMAGLASKVAFPSDLGGLLGGWSGATVSNGNVTANGNTVPLKRLYDGMGLIHKNMVPRRKNGAGGVTDDPDDPYDGGDLTPEDVQAAAKAAANTVGKDAPLPAPNDGDPDLAIDPSCFHGQLGEQALAVIGAKQDVDVARASWQDTQERYDLKSQYCAQLKGLDDAAQAALAAHAIEMRDLRDAKAITDDCSIALEHVSAAISGGSSSFGASSATEIAAGVTRILSNEFQHQMDNSEADYQVAAAKRSNDKEMMTCYNEADLSRVGITTAASQVTRAKTSAVASLVQIQNMRQRVAQLLFEGKAAVGREQGRTVASVAHHYWFGEKLALATSQFAWAKRVTYLALRALEYEFQLVANTPNASNTASLRTSVLGAKNASDLTNARTSLDAYQASLRINGKQPEQETLVLRMAKDILHLDDRSTVTSPHQSGERYPTLAQRFSDLLLSQSSTIYNADGTPFGQAIRFSLSADIAPNRCAERLWRVNATVQTSKPVSDKKIAVVLYKRNTFASTWCPDHGDGSALQTNSYRPNAQLFLDSGGTAAVTPATAFTDAAVGAWLNVPLGDFSQDAYVEGSTTALGGRGLYGDYILVIPWSSVASTKFGMEDITDVLIRVDYGYVSNAPVVNGKKHNVEAER